MGTHLLQSPQWAEFKSEYGTPAVNAGSVWYTKHSIPLTSNFFGYSARIDPFIIDFEKLKESLIENKCIALHLDVPNVTRGSELGDKAEELFEKFCVKSPRDEFAKGNFLVDLTLSEETLFENMHSKQRYNVRYAQKKGVVSHVGNTDEDFEKFFELYKETGIRQKFYYRPKSYFKKLFDVFNKDGLVNILTTSFGSKPLASWMLINYGDTLYYPYGGSTEDLKNLQASCLIGWEAILYGKSLKLKTFDMWGASADINDSTDSYYGFTNFKAKFGGKHVTYIDSYDFVVNTHMYKIFNAANKMRWKLLNALR